jgi:hypothetical protein
LPRLLQPVSALNELHQSLYEPRCWRAIHDIVVEGDSQIEDVARFDALLDDGWLAGDATHDQEDRLPGRRQAPAATATRHAQCGDTDRASPGYQTRRIAAAHDVDESMSYGGITASMTFFFGDDGRLLRSAGDPL